MMLSRTSCYNINIHTDIAIPVLLLCHRLLFPSFCTTSKLFRDIQIIRISRFNNCDFEQNIWRMSFNNLAFSVTKSTPTTSTTSNSVSTTGSTTGSTSNEAKQASKLQDSKSSTAKSQLLQGILSGSQSPQLSSVSETAPAIVTYGHELSRSSTSANSGNPTKTDLIGLFDKFDVSDRKKEPEYDDKFDMFKAKHTLQAAQEYTEKTVEPSITIMAQAGARTIDEEDEGVLEEKHLALLSPQDTIVQATGSSHKDLIDMDDVSSQKTENENPTAVLTEDTDQHEDSEEIEKSKYDEPKEADYNKTPEGPVTNTPSDLQAHPESLVAPKSNSIKPEIDQNNLDEIDADQSSAEEHYQLTQEEINDHKTDSPHRPEAWGRNRSISQVNINPAAQYQQSHKPFDFHVFLSQLKMKSADPVARYIKSFLISFNKQAAGLSLQQKAKIVKDFKLFMSDKFTLYEPFASMDEISLENAREGLEKLVMNRIYLYCYPPDILESHGPIEGLVKSDLEDDLLFEQQLEKFSWVNGTHLEVDVNKFVEFKANRNGEEYSFMENAVKEFNKINNYRAPRDKVICLLEACKNIFWYLKANKQETNADEFIPILIFVIINAKIDHLISNIHYIENFRGLEWLNRGETSYYISSIEGAISFIQNLGIDDLVISQDEYEAHMEAWAANDRIKREQQATQTIPIMSQPQPQANAGLSPSSVLMTSAGIFAKSISNLLSPSPQGSPSGTPQPEQSDIHTNELTDEPDPKLLKSTLDLLKEMFPDLDRSIMKDIVYMNKGNVDICLDACLQLVNDT